MNHLRLIACSPHVCRLFAGCSRHEKAVVRFGFAAYMQMFFFFSREGCRIVSGIMEENIVPTNSRQNYEEGIATILLPRNGHTF